MSQGLRGKRAIRVVLRSREAFAGVQMAIVGQLHRCQLPSERFRVLDVSVLFDICPRWSSGWGPGVYLATPEVSTACLMSLRPDSTSRHPEEGVGYECGLGGEDRICDLALHYSPQSMRRALARATASVPSARRTHTENVPQTQSIGEPRKTLLCHAVGLCWHTSPLSGHPYNASLTVPLHPSCTILDMAGRIHS